MGPDKMLITSLIPHFCVEPSQWDQGTPLSRIIKANRYLKAHLDKQLQIYVKDVP